MSPAEDKSLAEIPAGVDHPDDFKNPPKLFDARVKASAGNACTQVGELLVAEGIVLTPRQKVHLRRDIRLVSCTYWADRDHDDRVSQADVREQIGAVAERLAQLRSALVALSDRSRQHLTNEIMSPKAGDRPSFLRDFEKQVGKLEAACKPFERIRGANVPLTCVAHASSKLWDLREGLTGKPFGRQWKPARGIGETKSLAAYPDAYFVEVALKAIDPDVTAQQISTAFKKRVAQEKTCPKQSPKIGDDLS